MNGWRQAVRSRFLIFVWAICLFSVAARAAEEEGLLELWKQHMTAPDDHDAAMKACGEFTSANAGDPLLPVVRGLEAWHQLRTGRRSDALQMMAADLTAPPGVVNDGARRIALAWMTRVDREQIAAALQVYFRKQIAYPKSLDQLPAGERGPAADRFGKPWSYKLTGFSKLRGFPDQKYSLQSPTLGDVSDFKTAAKLPYAARIAAVPVQVLPAPGNTQAVKFKLAGGAAAIGVGQAAGDLYLAFVGEKIVVVCDYTHWKLLLRP